MERLVKSAARVSLPVRYYMLIPAVKLNNMFISHLIQMRSWLSLSVWSSLKSDGYRRNQAIAYTFVQPSLELVPVSFHLVISRVILSLCIKVLASVTPTVQLFLSSFHRQGPTSKMDFIQSLYWPYHTPFVHGQEVPVHTKLV